MPINSIGNSGLGVAGLQSGGLAGKGLAGGGGGMSIGGFRLIRGRATRAIPTGLVLPEARGGVAPYTYAIAAADLPGGVTFTAATRTLSGTPVSGSHSFDYTATDADGTMATRTITFPVHDENDPLHLSDFDEGKYGYGLSTYVPLMAMVIESGNNAAFASTNLFRRAPSGAAVGSIEDDPQTIETFGGGVFLSRYWWRGERSPPRTALFHSEQDMDGNAVTFDWNAWWAANTAAELFLQGTVGAINVEYGRPTTSGGAWSAWNQTSSTNAAWIRANMDDGDRFLLVIA